jgi:hypothetical protein
MQALIQTKYEQVTSDLAVNIYINAEERKVNKIIEPNEYKQLK